MKRTEPSRDLDSALERHHAVTRARIAQRLEVLEARGHALARAVSTAEKKAKKLAPIAAAVLVVGACAWTIWRVRRRAAAPRALFGRVSGRAPEAASGSMLTRFATSLALTAARHLVARAAARWAEHSQQDGVAAPSRPHAVIGHDGV